jgi:hypothetical protein
VDPETLRAVSYDPFYGTGEFVKAMWQMYRAGAPKGRAANKAEEKRP